MHYAHTLRNWKERFTENKDKVLKMFDENFLECLNFTYLLVKWHLDMEIRLYINFNLLRNQTQPHPRETIFTLKLLLLVK